MVAPTDRYNGTLHPPSTQWDHRCDVSPHRRELLTCRKQMSDPVFGPQRDDEGGERYLVRTLWDLGRWTGTAKVNPPL